MRTLKFKTYQAITFEAALDHLSQKDLDPFCLFRFLDVVITIGSSEKLQSSHVIEKNDF